MRLSLLFVIACAPKYVPSDQTGSPGGSGPRGATYTFVPGAGGGISNMGPVEAPSGMQLPQGDATPATLYGSMYAKIDIEIAYQPGAAPYTGQVGPFADIWEIFRGNLNDMFLGRGKTVTVPNTLAGMHTLPSGPSGSVTIDDILDTAFQHRQGMTGAGVASYYIMFFDGYFEGNTQVLGVSIGGTALIAMFKPVIKSTAQILRPNAPKYVEQATLVHEFGHAIGLVNNGVKMVTAHQDTAHGKHCSNPDCGMYWANEGGGGASFLNDYFSDGSVRLLDDNCLNDLHSAH